jgi:WhiB family redox-sensing transcriptional regulator
MDLALFFGEEGETRPEREAREALAKELCGWCKVRADCLTDALREPGQFGVWGGLTAEERTAARPGILRRKRGAA